MYRFPAYIIFMNKKNSSDFSPDPNYSHSMRHPRLSKEKIFQELILQDVQIPLGLLKKIVKVFCDK